MTRFDADLPPSGAGARFVAVVRARPAVFVVSIVLAAATIVLATGVALAAQLARQQLDRMTGSLQLAVYLAPSVTRADAEAMRSRIEVASVVAGAALRPREDALNALVEGDRLPSLATKPNPLPDVWVVTLRLPAAAVSAGRIAAEVEAARRTLAALPGVDRVRLDARWIDWVDRWSPAIAQGLDATGWIDLAVLTMMIGGLFFIAATAYAASSTTQPTPGPGTLALVGFASIAIAWGLVGLLGLVAAHVGSADLPARAANGVNESRGAGLSLVGASLIAAVLGSALAVRRS